MQEPDNSSASVAAISRELWGAILAALDSDNRRVRQRVWAAVHAAGSPTWDDDLDNPTVLVERLHTFTASAADTGGQVAEVIPLPWRTTRPVLCPPDSGLPPQFGGGEGA